MGRRVYYDILKHAVSGTLLVEEYHGSNQEPVLVLRGICILDAAASHRDPSRK